MHAGSAWDDACVVDRRAACTVGLAVGVIGRDGRWRRRVASWLGAGRLDVEAV